MSIEQKALKGRHIIARGEAPRIVVPPTLSPERAT